MGTTTPNMSIYIPTAGETNFSASFAVGMNNIDNHDHTGGPTKGKQLGASSIAPGSITGTQLNSSVVKPNSAVVLDGSPAQLHGAGILDALSQNGTNGIICQTSASTMASRTLTPGASSAITISAGNGVSGNPTIDLADPCPINNITSIGGYFNLKGNNATGGSNTSSFINSFSTTQSINAGVNANVIIIPNNSAWLFIAKVEGDQSYHASAIAYGYNSSGGNLFSIDNANCLFSSVATSTQINLQNTSGVNQTFSIVGIRIL